MNDLVTRLSTPGQEVEVGGLEPTPADFVKRLTTLRYVLLRFTGTRGGTELSFPLDPEACDFSGADLDRYSGTVHLEGELALDLIPVRIVADLDLRTLSGTGRLQPR